MRFLPLLSLTIGAYSLAIAPITQAQANSTFFTGEPPTLVSVETPDSTVDWPSPHYYFTFNVPTASPESLGKVTIAPELSGDPIAFDLSKTEAFQGTQGKKGQALTLQATTQDPQTGVITIAFATPVPSSTTFTISLQAYQNPSEEGTYLFRVYGFPAGDNAIGLDLGVGRLSFYKPF